MIPETLIAVTITIFWFIFGLGTARLVSKVKKSTISGVCIILWPLILIFSSMDERE
jgi:hypothetical protein